MLQLAAALVLGSLALPQAERQAPVPLVVHDPFFSLWSTTVRPTDGETTHASGRAIPMCVLARVDGDKVVRLLGAEPREIPAPDQSDTVVNFTTTHFVSLVAGVEFELAFIRPALPEELELLAWPITYVELQARSRDGNEHSIDVYLDVAALAAVETSTERVQGKLVAIDGLEAACVEALDPPWRASGSSGERLERGTLFASARQGPGVRANFGPAEELRRAFVERRSASVAPSFLEPRPAAEDALAIALRLEGRGGAGYVTAKADGAPVVARAIVAYDEPWSVRYGEERLRPYWRREGLDAAALLLAADAAGEQVVARCRAFDRELSMELVAFGGLQWMQSCQLAYRSALGTSKLCADTNGRPLSFVRDGDALRATSPVHAVATHCVSHLLLSSDLAKSMLVPLLDRAASSAWAAPFAPHDLGPFPLASALDDGAPLANATSIADCAHLILLVAAICQREGRVEFAARYWKPLSSWSRFLEEQASAMPASELDASTRAKSILALAAVARLARQMGSVARAQDLELLARAQAADWKRLAVAQGVGGENPSFALAWDKALGLELFGNELKVQDVEPAFLRALSEPALWSKWFARGAKGPLTWAPAPLSIGQALVNDARGGDAPWSWTASEPAAGWNELGFDAAAWSLGSGAFGAPLAGSKLVRTPWTAPKLWLRRTFELASVPSAEVRLAVELVGDAEIWLNGVFATRVSSGARGYFVESLAHEARAALRSGTNVLAIRCSGGTDSATIDAGLVTVPRSQGR